MSNYATFQKFGSNINRGVRNPYNVANPLTYCLYWDSSTKFLHGSTARYYTPQCYECQNYMADYCAGKFNDKNTWDPYCEIYYNNNNNNVWPNNAVINQSAANLSNCCGNARCSVTGGRLTTGEQLLRNSAERRFLEYPGCPTAYEVFDPNVGSSPMMMVPGCGQQSVDYTNAIVKINPATIDNDQLMNRVLKTPSIALDILAIIYAATKSQTKPLNLSGTRLGKHYEANSEQYESFLNRLYYLTPYSRFVGPAIAAALPTVGYDYPMNNCCTVSK